VDVMLPPAVRLSRTVHTHTVTHPRAIGGTSDTVVGPWTLCTLLVPCTYSEIHASLIG